MMVNSTTFTTQKMKFSVKDKFPTDLVTFTEEILNGKPDFLCSDLVRTVLSKIN